jgi:putative membrane protein
VQSIINLNSLRTISTESVKRFVKKNHFFSSLHHFVVSIYFFGTLGLLIPITRNIFLLLTPFALLTSFGILMYHHPFRSKYGDVLGFGLIFALGFLVELIGTQTGSVFGQYHYGQGLGWSLFGIPLVMGINWLVLIYSTNSIFSKFSKLYRAFLASSLMSVYDFFVEPIAPLLDFWHWYHGVVPLQNYLAWFIVSFLFHLIFQQFISTNHNRVALVIFLSQFLFFVTLNILF